QRNHVRSYYLFFFSSRRRHTRSKRDWSSDVCSSDLLIGICQSGSIECLSIVVNRQNSKSDRFASIELHPGEPGGYRVGNEIKVRRFTANNDTQTNHCVVPVGQCDLGC